MTIPGIDTATPQGPASPTPSGSGPTATPVAPTATPVAPTPTSQSGGGSSPASSPTPVPTVVLSAGPAPSEVCIPNITVTVFHDVNGNGRLDQGETPLPGWTVQVQGTNGGSITTGANGQAHLDNLTEGESYTVRLVMPPTSSWFSTTPTTITWLGACGEALFGVNQLMLPTTGGDLTTDTGAPSDIDPLQRTAVAMRRADDSFTSGALRLDALRMPLVRTTVQNGVLRVPEWAGGLSRSPLGGLRINWHASQFWPTRLPQPGATVELTLDGQPVTYRVTQVDIIPAGREGVPLETVLPDRLLLITCTGQGWSHRLLIWAERV